MKNTYKVGQFWEKWKGEDIFISAIQINRGNDTKNKKGNQAPMYKIYLSDGTSVEVKQ